MHHFEGTRCVYVCVCVRVQCDYHRLFSLNWSKKVLDEILYIKQFAVLVLLLLLPLVLCLLADRKPTIKVRTSSGRVDAMRLM